MNIRGYADQPSAQVTHQLQPSPAIPMGRPVSMAYVYVCVCVHVLWVGRPVWWVGPFLALAPVSTTNSLLIFTTSTKSIPLCVTKLSTFRIFFNTHQKAPKAYKHLVVSNRNIMFKQLTKKRYSLSISIVCMQTHKCLNSPAMEQESSVYQWRL